VGEQTRNPNITFADLYLADIGPELHVVCSDLTTKRAFVMNRENFPDFEVALAVRMSMSIPLFFAAVMCDSLTPTWTKG